MDSFFFGLNAAPQVLHFIGLARSSRALEKHAAEQ
jgi:hypothetical protein